MCRSDAFLYERLSIKFHKEYIPFIDNCFHKMGFAPFHNHKVTQNPIFT